MKNISNIHINLYNFLLHITFVRAKIEMSWFRNSSDTPFSYKWGAYGQQINESLLKHLSPLGWEHINLTGDYVWRQGKVMEKGEFRPIQRQQNLNMLYNPNS